MLNKKKFGCTGAGRGRESAYARTGGTRYRVNGAERARVTFRKINYGPGVAGLRDPETRPVGHQNVMPRPPLRGNSVRVPLPRNSKPETQEPILICLKMKGNVCRTTAAGLKTHRNKLSGEFSGFRERNRKSTPLHLARSLRER
jgi:hypothetical protein